MCIYIYIYILLQAPPQPRPGPAAGGLRRSAETSILYYTILHYDLHGSLTAMHSGVHKGGFSKRGFSNWACFQFAHQQRNLMYYNCTRENT